MSNGTSEIAKRTLGLEVKAEAITASVAPVERALIPFLKTSVDDETTWKKGEAPTRLRMDQLNVISQRNGVPRFPNLESIDAIVNPRTQLVYKLTSEWTPGAPPIAPFPSALEEERQLRNLGERFVALPEAEPPVDFYNALKQLELTGTIAPQSAKQVIAYLVVHHTRKYSPRPVWIIQTRGIDIPMEGYAAMSDVPVDARNHMRHIIDATTGAWLYSDTAPQPVD
ncbi:MAG: hypothetical protein ABI877_00155 [Gemmatimonadaceae bacterium]